MVSASFVTANHTVNNSGKLLESETVIRKLSFALRPRCPIFVYCGAISALPGIFSLVTAVQFSNGQEVLFIDYSGTKYVRLALPVLRDVITSVFSKNGHKAPPKSLEHLRLREPRRQPLQTFTQKTPQPTALKPPSTARTAGRSDRVKRRFRRQPFILLSFSSSKKP